MRISPKRPPIQPVLPKTRNFCVDATGTVSVPGGIGDAQPKEACASALARSAGHQCFQIYRHIGRINRPCVIPVRRRSTSATPLAAMFWMRIEYHLRRLRTTEIAVDFQRPCPPWGFELVAPRPASTECPRLASSCITADKLSDALHWFAAWPSDSTALAALQRSRMLGNIGGWLGMSQDRSLPQSKSQQGAGRGARP